MCTIIMKEYTDVTQATTILQSQQHSSVRHKYLILTDEGDVTIKSTKGNKAPGINGLFSGQGSWHRRSPNKGHYCVINIQYKDKMKAEATIPHTFKWFACIRGKVKADIKNNELITSLSCTLYLFRHPRYPKQKS